MLYTTRQGDLAELAGPKPRSHGEAEKALHSRIHWLSQRALIVALFISFTVLSILERGLLAVFDHRLR